MKLQGSGIKTLIFFSFAKMLPSVSTMLKTFERDILRHFTLFFAYLQWLPLYRDLHGRLFLWILIVLMGLKQMLVFTKQFNIFQRCREGVPEVPLPFISSVGKAKSATSSLCEGAVLLGRGDALWHWVTGVSGHGGGTGAGLPMHFLTVTSFKAFCCCQSSLFTFHSCNEL